MKSLLVIPRPCCMCGCGFNRIVSCRPRLTERTCMYNVLCNSLVEIAKLLLSVDKELSELRITRVICLSAFWRLLWRHVVMTTQHTRGYRRNVRLIYSLSHTHSHWHSHWHSACDPLTHSMCIYTYTVVAQPAISANNGYKITFLFRLNWLPVGFWLHVKHLHSDSDSPLSALLGYSSASRFRYPSDDINHAFYSHLARLHPVQHYILLYRKKTAYSVSKVI